MKMNPPQKLAATMTAMFFLWSIIAESVPNTNVTTVLCNVGVYTSGDPFAISLAYVLEELQTKTPTQKNYDYHNISPYPNAFAYGHACLQLVSDNL